MLVQDQTHYKNRLKAANNKQLIFWQYRRARLDFSNKVGGLIVRLQPYRNNFERCIQNNMQQWYLLGILDMLPRAVKESRHYTDCPVLRQ